jgi:hypothetical protein
MVLPVGVWRLPALGHLSDEQEPTLALAEDTAPAQVRRGTAVVGHLANERRVTDQPQLNGGVTRTGRRW